MNRRCPRIVTTLAGLALVMAPCASNGQGPPPAQNVQAPPPGAQRVAAPPDQEPPPPEAQQPVPPAPQPAGAQPAQAPPASGPPAQPPGEAPAAVVGPSVTPIRLRFTYRDASFWRPGADDWTQAQVNTALAPGDALYTGSGGSLELQIAGRSFVRAAGETQLGLENQETDFQQFQITTGHVSLDLRNLKSGQTFEVDTPNAVFTIGSVGYYRVDVNGDTTTFITRRGGHATVTPAGGEAMGVAPSEEVVVQGDTTPTVGTYVAPQLDAWDQWNYQRTEHLIDSVSARYMNAGISGTDELDHYGTWRTTSDYGPVWVPSGVPQDWAPYSTGRWTWDPLYGWTWVDYAPWGWAPYHYGRWVNQTGYWGWAPGPVVAAPVYAPALVAFFGGAGFGVSIGFGAPAVGWVALGWGEPVVPWWGGAGFVGVPWWGGWGGPRVVNNVVVNRTTIINANTINVYRNAGVNNAVIAERAAQFGRGTAQRVRVPIADTHQLEPVRGKLPVQPAAASLAAREGRGVRPPQTSLNRSVVATRAPHDTASTLRAQGLKVPEKTTAAPRLVSAPKGPHPAFAAPRAPFGQQGAAERQPPPVHQQFENMPRAAQQPLPASKPPPVGNLHAPSQQAAPSARGATEQHASVPPPHQPNLSRTHQAPSQPAAVPQPHAAPQQQRHAAPPAPPEHITRTMPGEPANRYYRSAPQVQRPMPPSAPPRVSAPPQQHSAPAPHSMHQQHR